jgi:tRNA(fMet)-specific endonuclease VapC
MFLLDTDICSAHLRRPAGLTHRFVQHAGHLAISTINLGELLAWAHKQNDPAPIEAKIYALVADLLVIDFDSACAQ